MSDNIPVAVFKRKAKKSTTAAGGNPRKRSADERDHDEDKLQDEREKEDTVVEVSKKRDTKASSLLVSSSKQQQSATGTRGNADTLAYKASGTAATLSNDSATRTLDLDGIIQNHSKGSSGDAANESAPNEAESEGGLYKGLGKYKEYVNKKVEKVTQSNAGGLRAGPLKGQTNVRISSRFDYQPHVCKDYKETGNCGYGDSCIYMHDRGDYKMGWQLDLEWEEEQKRKQKEAEMARFMAEHAVQEEEVDEDDDLPMVCPICQSDFKSPISTKCKHYFCENCAIRHHSQSKKCFICDTPTSGTFTGARELKERIAAKKLRMEERERAIRQKHNNEEDEATNDGHCVDCTVQVATLGCDQCRDLFCQACFEIVHRSGNRRNHTTRSMKSSESTEEETPAAPAQEADGQEDIDMNEFDNETTEEDVGDFFIERAKYIPLRLSLSERKYMRLLEAALNVSEYTDKIDILSYTSKTRRQVSQIQEVCSIISGLVLAADYKAGQELLRDKNFEDNATFIQEIFELGRRHKIMNPEKMRSTYGKLLYMLQDSQIEEVKETLQFSCVGKIRTVHAVLTEANALGLLKDKLIGVATMEIISDGKSRREIQEEIAKKERAIKVLASKYSNREFNAEAVKQCLYSIGDNHAFLRTNRDPCETMIQYLKRYFNADEAEKGYSLSIQMGISGARLNHDHRRQYNFVLQSLTLWREILNEMFMLWFVAEEDLLDPDNYYRLRDTGQGLNRVQDAPRTSRIMHLILRRVQQKVGSWVGSSVIHLGDINVPNAFLFIDKYTQIYRILLPIVRCLEALPKLASKDPAIDRYFTEKFGGVDDLRKTVLADFFKHAFDGSGADNFFSAGSCIDGRLTSAWNWCSTVEKKPYFHAFLLTGFVGFDGEWAG